MSYLSTDPGDRAEFIASLRALADHLVANPGLPVPLHGEQVTVHADHTEHGGIAQVDHIAALLGVTATDDTPGGGHYYAYKSFGVISYDVVSIPESRMARLAAENTYRGCVTPDAVQASTG